jgi:hypothetical protein
MKTNFSVFMNKIVSEIDNRIWCGPENPTINCEKIDRDGVYDERYLIDVTFPSGWGNITFGATIMYEKYDDGEDYSMFSMVVISNEDFRTTEVHDFIKFVRSKWREDGNYEDDRNYEDDGPKDEDPVATEVSVC